MKILITVDVDEDCSAADPDHETGITKDAVDQLFGLHPEYHAPLGWLGEVEDVARVA